MENIEYLGLVAGFLTTIAFLPQILKIFRTKSTKDISLIMYVVYCIGLIIWIIYGYLTSAYSIMVASSVTLILALTTILIKLYWKT